MPTDLIVDWIEFLYYRKMFRKKFKKCYKKIPVTSLQQKQYGVVLQN